MYNSICLSYNSQILGKFDQSDPLVMIAMICAEILGPQFFEHIKTGIKITNISKHLLWNDSSIIGYSPAMILVLIG